MDTCSETRRRIHKRAPPVMNPKKNMQSEGRARLADLGEEVKEYGDGGTVTLSESEMACQYWT